MELNPEAFIKNIVWPAIPSRNGATMLAMLFQLEQSQWLPPKTLRQRQMAQAGLLLQHALSTVPFYNPLLKEMNGRKIDDTLWNELPILERETIQSRFEDLKSQNIPADHGTTITLGSSGSTGRPITVLGTAVTACFWEALTAREHLWHHRDFSGKLAGIRSKIERSTTPRWGNWCQGLITGPGCGLSISEDIDNQLAWLVEENPDYLLTHPSNLSALVRRAIEREIVLPQLKQVRTFGEMLRPDLRALCRTAWNIGLADIYSAEEVGYIALQCPQHEHYHIQAESLLVEILDDHNRPCMPGEIGHVVVTTLHNFAMPLIRYRLRDQAEVGEPCPCGRGLPVLRRIVGRQRNMIRLPDGRQHWPSFPGSLWREVVPALQQFQLIQHDLNLIEVRIASSIPVSTEQEQGLAKILKEKLGYPFKFNFTYVDRINPTANGKFEDFVSMISA